MKQLLSLFDHSGEWSQPFWEAGWNVYCWDIKIDEFRNIKDLDDVGEILELFEYIDGIIAAPPCTDFTNSGAQYWSQKDQDGRTAESLELVYQVQRLADLFTPTDPDYYAEGGSFFWAMENPVGRLNKLCPELGKPYIFDPYEFAGYTNPDTKELDRIRAKNGIGVTAQEVETVIQANAYTKKTCLWGDFNRNLVKKSIAPVKCAPQGSYTQRLGGKSDKTKELRSITPAGFAQAFCNANQDHRPALELFD